MKTLVSLLVVILLLGIASLGVEAHRLLMREQGSGLQIVYDDETAAAFARVYVYDSNDVIVEQGLTDQQGNYKIETTEAKYVISSDGLGHQAELQLGTNVLEPNRFLNALLGVAILTVMGAGAQWFVKRTQRYKSEK